MFGIILIFAVFTLTNEWSGHGIFASFEFHDSTRKLTTNDFNSRKNRWLHHGRMSSNITFYFNKFLNPSFCSSVSEVGNSIVKVTYKSPFCVAKP